MTEVACSAVYREGLVLVRGGTAPSPLQGEKPKRLMMTAENLHNLEKRERRQYEMQQKNEVNNKEKRKETDTKQFE